MTVSKRQSILQNLSKKQHKAKGEYPCAKFIQRWLASLSGIRVLLYTGRRNVEPVQFVLPKNREEVDLTALSYQIKVVSEDYGTEAAMDFAKENDR